MLEKLVLNTWVPPGLFTGGQPGNILKQLRIGRLRIFYTSSWNCGSLYRSIAGATNCAQPSLVLISGILPSFFSHFDLKKFMGTGADD
jgi:hypothetical protein